MTQRRRRIQPRLDVHARQQAVLESLRELGDVKSACSINGVATKNFWNWVANNPEFRARVDQIRREQVAMLEDTVFKKALDGDPKSIEFLLKAWDRDKYGDKLEHLNKGDGQLRVAGFASMTEAKRAAMVEFLRVCFQSPEGLKLIDEARHGKVRDDGGWTEEA